MEEKTYIEIWDSTSNTPHITFCQSNLHPIYSIEFKNVKERNKFLYEQAKKFYIELYKPQDKLIQLRCYLRGLMEDGYYGIDYATPKKINNLRETIQGIENFSKIKEENYERNKK